MREKIHEQFQKHFGGSGEFYASAGRINLIGEHTDYNGGFVFPGAVDKGIVAKILLGQVCVRSMQGDHQEMR